VSDLLKYYHFPFLIAIFFIQMKAEKKTVHSLHGSRFVGWGRLYKLNKIAVNENSKTAKSIKVLLLRFISCGLAHLHCRFFHLALQMFTESVLL
jgi:hypothetical protein